MHLADALSRCLQVKSMILGLLGILYNVLKSKNGKRSLYSEGLAVALGNKISLI